MTKSRNCFKGFAFFLLVMTLSMTAVSAETSWKVVGWETGLGYYSTSEYAVLVPADCRVTEDNYGWCEALDSPDTINLMISFNDPLLGTYYNEVLVYESLDANNVPIIRYDLIVGGGGYIYLDPWPPCNPVHSCIDWEQGLVSWFPFDETSGTTAYNMFGTYNGLHQNGPVPVYGKVSYALQLDGVNDYVKVGNYSKLNFGTGDFTIETWIKTSDTYGTIVSKRPDSSSPGYLFMVYNSRLLLQLNDNISGWYNYYSSATPTLSDNKWHHVAVTVDRNNTQGGKFYVDGNVVYTFNPTNRQGSISSTAELWIGRQSSGSYLSGIVDELCFYNRVLSYSELEYIFMANEFGKCKLANLSVDLDVTVIHKVIAEAVASGGSESYSFTWTCSSNLQKVMEYSAGNESIAQFSKLSSTGLAWVEIQVTDTNTGRTTYQMESFYLDALMEPY